ncbi:MAG: STAS domain-containing protein [Chloroflexia bacterium]
MDPNDLSEKFQELSIMYELLSSIGTSLEMEKTVEDFLERVTSRFFCEVGAFYLWDPESGTFRLLASRGVAEAERGQGEQLPADNPAGRRLLQGERGFIVQGKEAPSWSLYPFSAERIQAILVVAARFRGALLGALQLERFSPSFFTERDVSKLGSLMDRLAIALNHSRLYWELQESRSRLEEAQKRLLHLVAELSTPVIPVLEGILIMPLIGSIDSERAGRILDSLLHGIEEYRARVAILDITGVPMIDSQVANHLVRAMLAAQLLGAHPILTGISPEVAQTMVQLGIDLAGITSCADLQQGVALALRLLGER